MSEDDCLLTTIETPLGPVTAGARRDGICLLSYSEPDRARELTMLRRRSGCEARPGKSPHLEQLSHELHEYFAGRLTTFSVPLVTVGTPFQQRVWAQLLRIPYGTTCSYEALATAIDAPDAQRAVGHANGSNPIAIVIPCHRVINKSGRLGGYGGELWRKQALLRLEQSSYSLPLEDIRSSCA